MVRSRTRKGSCVAGHRIAAPTSPGSRTPPGTFCPSSKAGEGKDDEPGRDPQTEREGRDVPTPAGCAGSAGRDGARPRHDRGRRRPRCDGRAEWRSGKTAHGPPPAHRVGDASLALRAELLAHLPIVAKRIGDAPGSPTVLFMYWRHHRSSGSDRLLEQQVRIV